MRLPLAVVAAGLASALGALILGEYPLTGTTPYVAGALFGLVVAELAVFVAGHGGLRGPAKLLVVALPAGGMAWAAWISAGRDWHFVPGGAWAGVALAPLAAFLWLRRGPAATG
ncbi:MAG TPA: hypothetical protein VFA94_07065 [Acidimicrobiales bacterium]|nr:hypothetical protein [Acidimicrobiales bacterium]